MTKAQTPYIKTRYRIASAVLRVCRVLEISPERVCHHANLPADTLTEPDRGVSAAQVYALWDAVHTEAGKPNLPVELASMSVRTGFLPAVFAFACSPDVWIGLQRLAKFKPLVGPCVLITELTDDALIVEMLPVDDTPQPSGFATYECVFITELIRQHTGQDITPLSTQVPPRANFETILKEYLGYAPSPGPHLRLVFSAEIAKLPLMSENAELWQVFEADLQRRMLDLEAMQPIDIRVRQALLELLPGGSPSAQAVSDRLRLSKRTLHRRLSEVGTPFQAVLDDTRHELALHYLGQDEIGMEEISYLLGFGDPNSFFRAFRGWTGTTPMQMRQKLTPIPARNA